MSRTDGGRKRDLTHSCEHYGEKSDSWSALSTLTVTVDVGS